MHRIDKMNQRQQIGIVLIIIILVVIGFLLFGGNVPLQGNLNGIAAAESRACRALSGACEREILETDKAGENCKRYEADCLLEEGEAEALDFGDEDFVESSENLFAE